MRFVREYRSYVISTSVLFMLVALLPFILAVMMVDVGCDVGLPTAANVLIVALCTVLVGVVNYYCSYRSDMRLILGLAEILDPPEGKNTKRTYTVGKLRFTCETKYRFNYDSHSWTDYDFGVWVTSAEPDTWTRVFCGTRTRGAWTMRGPWERDTLVAIREFRQKKAEEKRQARKKQIEDERRSRQAEREERRRSEAQAKRLRRTYLEDRE